MRKIRQGIFETNSSSTHSICFNFKKAQPSKLSISEGTCYIKGVDQMDDFDDYTVKGEYNKLNYIFTWMFIRDSGSDESNDPFYWPEPCELETGMFESQYRNLLEAIKRKYPEVEKICFEDPMHAEFDHQTSSWESDPIIDLDDPDAIYDYLFNDHIYIQIGHD